MKLKSLLAVAALLTAPALLAGPVSAADYDGRRGDRWSESRFDRGHDFDGPRYHQRRFHRRLAWWRYDRPWRWHQRRHVRVRDYQNLSLSHRRRFR